MNVTMVLFIVGWILEFEAAFLLLPAIVAIIYHETSSCIAFVVSAIISLLLGLLLKAKKPKTKDLYMREGFATVALGWITLSAVGAIPFVISGDIPSYVDALFETISGFTTTGASILTDVEALSKSGLFWRSFTHWIGGMGVFVFIMAVLPLMGGSTINLMRAESTGPSVGKLVPRVRDTAFILYSMYLGLTVIGAIVYCICGMTLYESLTIIFGTVGTGGFGIVNSSASDYSPAIQWAITIFMILSGINYSVYFCIIKRKLKDAFSIEEVKWYLGIIALSTLAITINIRNSFDSVSDSLRHAAFQVGSIITTTGFSTTNFDAWPAFSKTILVILMFVGACSGSTGGGMKISRLLIYIKCARKELSVMAHPRQIQKIQMDGHGVAHETIRSANVYLVSYFLILFISVLLVSVDNFDFTTNFTAVVATLNNIGPGLGMVGPCGNFQSFSAFSKIVLMFNMLAGRLELYPMLILFKLSCWKKY